MNILDRGGSTISSLQQSQSVYSYTITYCDNADLINRINMCSKPHLFNLSEVNCNFTQQDFLDLYACINNFISYNIAGRGEDSPPNAPYLANSARLAARALVDGRCENNDSGIRFGFNPDLQAKIRRIDGDNQMRFVYSINSSWLEELDDWQECYRRNNPDTNLDYVPVPAGPGAATPHRAILITNGFNVPCSNWQCDRATQNAPEYGTATACCSQRIDDPSCF